MKQSIFLSAAAIASIFPFVIAQQDYGPKEDDAAERAACYPQGREGDTIAPCLSIESIEVACQPNGTDAIDFEAHAQCMCGGSYFSDWLGCQDCLLTHGFRNQRDLVYWGNVMSTASSKLCSGTPSAPFQSVFASVISGGQVSIVTTGATQRSDEVSKATDVSLYYTATGDQGPGKITGEAAQATAEATIASTSGTETFSDSTTSSSEDSSTVATSGSESAEETATSSSSAAAVTRGVGIAMALGAAIVAVM